MNALTKHLDNYLKLRRQLGFKLRDAGRLLRQFVRFAEERGASAITTKLALGWAAPSKLKPARSATRLGVVRQFAEYVSAIDPRTEVPAQKLLPYQYRRRTPHLYREEEVGRLIEAARQIDPENPIKGATYSILFGLLAVTGMRINEAVSLERSDVDLVAGLLTIRRAKGNKSRLVPLHVSTREALRRYASVRDHAYPRPLSSKFFVAEQGTPPHPSTVNRWFLLVACQLGLRRPGDRRGPRVHDLRHHFAIQTLLRWYRADVDVEVHLPELSTYLGHVHVRDTYWYLSATPELLRLATRRWERKEAGR
jgi:integrase/recombinase XerD